jgi:biopolymer transport protein ExbD
MRLPSSEPEFGAPNMMPLIDIVFLLLIFFLMASRFEQEEREMNVVLPDVAASAQPVAGTQELIVNITADGKYTVAKQQYSEEQLGALLKLTHQKNPHLPVVIRGDGRAAWKYGVRVMGLCNRAEIRDYRVAAVQEQ